MEKSNVKKLAFAGILIAVGVVCSPLSIPVGASRCFPVQHFVNVLAAVLLGPWYGAGMAAVTSLLRVMLGTGSLLAFPGSMCGALLCGLIFRYTGNEWLTYAGEIFGTAVIGGLLAYPVATLLMSKEAALFAYILPFFVSTAGGTILAAVLLTVLKKTKVLSRISFAENPGRSAK